MSDLKEMIQSTYGNAVNKGFYSAYSDIVLSLHREDQDLLPHYQTHWMLARLMLVVTEVAEAAEALRKGEVESFFEELADIDIRLKDLIGFSETIYAIPGHYEETLKNKMAYNLSRPYMHGKGA